MDVHCTTEEGGQTKIGWLLMLGEGVAEDFFTDVINERPANQLNFSVVMFLLKRAKIGRKKFFSLLLPTCILLIVINRYSR